MENEEKRKRERKRKKERKKERGRKKEYVLLKKEGDESYDKKLMW